jgi:aminocarboxymuconate-semialdehyde decarboxylase
MARKIAIDVHAHTAIPAAEEIARGQDAWRNAARAGAQSLGQQSATHNRRLMETSWLKRLTDPAERLRAMDSMRIDIQAVSVSPNGYHYWADRETAERIVALTNEGIAELCAHNPERLAGLGTVALQQPDMAVAQLERAVGELQLKGVIISTVVNGVDIADSRFEPLWSKAEELDAVMLVHPAGCAIEARLSEYYLSNVIGNPLETTIALARLVFGGILDRHPRLRLCAAHGGGYFPFYAGRFDHAWHTRPEAHTCAHAPSEYLRRIWFDSLVYTPESLEYLIRRAGTSQIVIGTDYPFDMGIEDPLERLDAVGTLIGRERDAIAGGNAAALLKLR